MKNAAKFSSSSRLSFLVFRFVTLSLSVSLSHFAVAQKAAYNIAATLNDNDNSIDGFITLDYTNTTSDSIHFLWFNIYPNAFKSDRTAFSEYMLDKGTTAFYFSDQNQKGYINRLDFRSGDNILKTEDHPLYIDIIKVIFDKSLAPGASKKITTPFHVKLPYNFDGIGYKGMQYDLKYWYPAVAEYIQPLTDAGSSSNVAGDYSVQFSVNKGFSVTSPLLTPKSFADAVTNPDSLKTVSFDAASVKDIPITIVKPQTPKVTSAKSAAAEHDIFKFLSGSSKEISHSSKTDSIVNNKIKKLFSRPVLPAIGYNEYDGVQLGMLTHNYHTQKSLSYYLAPVYTFESKTIAGIAGASYRIIPKEHVIVNRASDRTKERDVIPNGASGRTKERDVIPNGASGRTKERDVIPNGAKRSEESAKSTGLKKIISEIELGFTASSFSYDDGMDKNNEKVFANLFKIVPFIKVKLPSRFPFIEKTLTFKTYIINERDLEFVRDSVGPIFRQEEGEYATRFVNELTFDYSSGRVLYPYRAQLQVQQGLTWYRVNATGNYFFNYPKGGGMNVRLFAAKFGYIGSLSSSEKFRHLRYMPKLTAVRGIEDYTYSNYFIGRNVFDGFASRQIMMRDGGLKLRTDLFEGLQGRSDNWIASLNLNTTIPQIFPVKVPLKIFVDAGTHSEAWDDENTNPRFLYVAGLQLSLFKDILNIYAPLMYSKQFRDQLKTVPEENKFFKKVSFSVDLQRLSLKTVL